MPKISIIRDSQIELPNIRMTLEQTSPEESSEYTSNQNFNDTMQTKVVGVMMPLLALNGIAISYGSLIEFHLDWTKHIPEVEFAFYDREGTFSQFTKPGISNELQVQILPPFDNAYKKVNLLFYITEILIDYGQVRGRAKYKVLDFIQGQFKCLGEVSTFELFDRVSVDTGLGFASNVELTEDVRFIYAPMKSYCDIIESEIENSNSGEEHVYDYWVDLWNNLVLCDMYDRYSSVDDEDSMQVWVSDKLNDPRSETKINPIQTTAIFTNTPPSFNTELYLTGYTINNAPASYSQGTSKVVSLYSEATHDYVDNYIMDGDSEDEFLTHEYGGEFYGDYNYLIAKQCRDIYLRKIYGETISVYTRNPMLGIMRGDQVRVVWYDANTVSVEKLRVMEDLGMTPQVDQDLGWLSSFVVPKDQESGVVLNTNISGQYTVIGVYITFKDHQWTQEYVLARPAMNKTPLIEDIEYTSTPE